VFAGQARNDNRGVNVKRGIRAKCEMGWRPCMPPLGYFTRAATGKQRDVIVDSERAPFIIKMFEMCADGKSGRHIKQFLMDNDVRTRKDKMVHLSMIYKILKNPFYYGCFEYPAGSGSWYQGKHEPLVSKGLFDRVQDQLIVPQKSKWGAKEFPFRRFLICGSCGAQVVGEEKIKNLKDGTRKRYVYYHCSRQIDYDCREPFVRQDMIIKGLVDLSSGFQIESKDCEPGLRAAVTRYGLMVTTNRPFEGYAKYVLEHGTDFEKTRLVRNLGVRLVLHNRQLSIA